MEEVELNYKVNNFGDNINLTISKLGQNYTKDEDIKYILFWNEAYGNKVFIHALFHNWNKVSWDKA